MEARFLWALLSTILFTSCKKQIAQQDTAAPANSNGYIQYTIRKGEHYAEGNENRSLNITQLKFQALFDSTCIYSTAKSSNSDDVNKLYGFSDCNTFHHVNSARFGWRWNGQALEIMAYCYANSQRLIKSMGTIDIGQPAIMSIRVEGAQYVFEMNEAVVRMPRNCGTPKAEGYQLYPYFGGDETAPHDVRIWIKLLN